MNSLIRPFEPLIFHDPFLIWINYFPRSQTLHDFFPSSHLHEIDSTISDDVIHVLTHVIFVLDLSLFLFLRKHKGRYYEILIGWFHCLFD